MPHDSYPFELPPLLYPYDAFEPYIDAETMYYHHDRHFQTYIDRLNEALAKVPRLQTATLEQLLANPNVIPMSVREAVLNNGGGVYNHTKFFDAIAPAESARNIPNDKLLGKIERAFGSWESFKERFSAEALKVFGSGWTYLVKTAKGELRIVNLKNQDTLLYRGLSPVILFDVWEHAYYLKYKNDRALYVENLWSVLAFPDLF